MLSDDSEHTAMVAEALLASGLLVSGLLVSGGDPDRFAAQLARRLRGWLLAFPPGVGLATARGILRSCVGFSPARSGVDSAGNGPAMRAALLGLVARDDAQLVALVRASTRITHSDPRAEQGACLVARWARHAHAPRATLVGFVAQLEDPSFRAAVERAIAAAERGVELDELRAEMGWARGVSGFIVDTLAAAAYCWLRCRDDPRAAIETAVRLGGDTDTVAAIVGALAGARCGAQGLPRAWIDGIWDWPVNPARLRSLAAALDGEGGEGWRSRAPWVARSARNLLLFAVVLTHLVGRAVGR